MPSIDGKPLNKLYDVKDCLKNVIANKTNDLVVAAGDDENDIAMLVPESYSDIKGEIKPFLGIQVIR